jgi:hypothetical protein
MNQIKAYIEAAIQSQGFVCPNIGPLQCRTNSIVFKDVALDMGLEYVTLKGRTVMVRCKAI